MTRLIVNMNGDSKETLIEDRMNAYHAIDKAIQEYAKGAPHGRNYQVNTNPDDFKNDSKTFHDNMTFLYNLKNALEDEAIRISDM